MLGCGRSRTAISVIALSGRLDVHTVGRPALGVRLVQATHAELQDRIQEALASAT
jgi:hypothetical protein